MKPLRVAIAEDNWFVAEHLGSELAGLGHLVIGAACTGEGLVSLVARQRPDLALVDIRLAGGDDGLAAAQEIGARFDVPAIGATARLAPAEARQAGLLGLLRKPYTTAALNAVLTEAAHWLERRHRDRPFIWR